VIVGDIEGLTAVRQRYLEAIAHGEGELVVELGAGCLGLDPPGALAGLELASVTAREPPPIDVTLRAPDGLCVLAGIPISVAARRITIENVAVVGCTSAPIVVTASGGVALRDVVVLGSHPTRYDRATVDITAAGDAGIAVDVERTVVARNDSQDAHLGLYSGSSAWLDEIRLTDLVVDGGSPDATIALEAVRSLRARDARLRRAAARVLLRLRWPIVDGELAACTLAAPEDGLVEVREETPVVPKLRLTDGTVLTAARDRLPDLLEVDETVEDAPVEAVDAAVDDAIAAAAAHVVQVDGRLERLVV
jgi:hypothetical protein